MWESRRAVSPRRSRSPTPPQPRPRHGAGKRRDGAATNTGRARTAHRMCNDGRHHVQGRKAAYIKMWRRGGGCKEKTGSSRFVAAEETEDGGESSLFVAGIRRRLPHRQLHGKARHPPRPPLPHPTPPRRTENSRNGKQKVTASPRTSLFVANNLPICRQSHKEVPYLSPEPSQTVAAKLPICRTTLPKCRRTPPQPTDTQTVAQPLLINDTKR